MAAPPTGAGHGDPTNIELWHALRLFCEHCANNPAVQMRVSRCGLEQELVEIELTQEDDALEAVQVPEPRHVKYATVMAKNLRRSSHRSTMPANTSRRSVDAGMTVEERRELTRAQREVMWNLQREGVVTVVRPGDDPVPYKRQGNPAVNTPQCIRLRHALRKKPLIQEISNEYWCFPGLNPDGAGEMKKESYVQLNRKLHLALIPDTTDEETCRSAEVDWLRDTRRWGGKMPKEAFFSSMFELADIWTENIDEEEYTAFLWLLLETITDTNVVPPSFKSDQDIECIVDEDIFKHASRVRAALPDIGEGDSRRNMFLPLDIDAINAVIAANGGGMTTNNLSPQLKEKHVDRLRALRQRLQALKQLRTGSLTEADLVGNEGIYGSVDGDGNTMDAFETSQVMEAPYHLSGEDSDESERLIITTERSESLRDDPQSGDGDAYTTRDTDGSRYNVESESKDPETIPRKSATEPAHRATILENRPMPDRHVSDRRHRHSSEASAPDLHAGDGVHSSPQLDRQEMIRGEGGGNRYGEDVGIAEGNAQNSDEEKRNQKPRPTRLRGGSGMIPTDAAPETSQVDLTSRESVHTVTRTPHSRGKRTEMPWHDTREGVSDGRGPPVEEALGDNDMVWEGESTPLLADATGYKTKSSDSNKIAAPTNGGEVSISLPRPVDVSGTVSGVITPRAMGGAAISGDINDEADTTLRTASDSHRAEGKYADLDFGSGATGPRGAHRRHHGDGSSGARETQREGALVGSVDLAPVSASSSMLPRVAGSTHAGDGGSIGSGSEGSGSEGSGRGGAGGGGSIDVELTRIEGSYDRESSDDLSGGGRAVAESQEVEPARKQRERGKTTMIRHIPSGALMVASEHVGADAFSSVESGVNRDRMTELTEKEDGERATGSDAGRTGVRNDTPGTVSRTSNVGGSCGRGVNSDVSEDCMSKLTDEEYREREVEVCTRRDGGENGTPGAVKRHEEAADVCGREIGTGGSGDCMAKLTKDEDRGLSAGVGKRREGTGNGTPKSVNRPGERTADSRGREAESGERRTRVANQIEDADKERATRLGKSREGAGNGTPSGVNRAKKAGDSGGRGVESNGSKYGMETPSGNEDRERAEGMRRSQEGAVNSTSNSVKRDGKAGNNDDRELKSSGPRDRKTKQIENEDRGQAAGADKHREWTGSGAPNSVKRDGKAGHSSGREVESSGSKGCMAKQAQDEVGKRVAGVGKNREGSGNGTPSSLDQIGKAGDSCGRKVESGESRSCMAELPEDADRERAARVGKNREDTGNNASSSVERDGKAGDSNVREVESRGSGHGIAALSEDTGRERAARVGKNREETRHNESSSVERDGKAGDSNVREVESRGSGGCIAALSEDTDRGWAAGVGKNRKRTGNNTSSSMKQEGKAGDSSVREVEGRGSGGCMVTLPEDEDGEQAAGAGKSREGTGKGAPSNVERGGKAGGSDDHHCTTGLRSRTEQRKGRNSSSREEGINGGKKSSSHLSPLSPNKNNKISAFRPAGSSGGWGGITGTTDETWAALIEQAKEERWEALSQSRARRGAPRKRTARERTASEHGPASSLVTKAAKVAQQSLPGVKPHSPSRERGGAAETGGDSFPGRQQEQRSAHSKRRIPGGKKNNEQDHAWAQQGPSSSFQSEKRRRVNGSVVGSSSQGKSSAEHDNQKRNIADQPVQHTLLEGSGEAKSNDQRREDNLKQPREEVSGGERVAWHSADTKLDGRESSPNDEAHVSLSDDKPSKTHPDNLRIPPGEGSSNDARRAPVGEENIHVEVHSATNDAGLNSGRDDRGDGGALESDHADTQAVVNGSAGRHQQPPDYVGSVSPTKRLVASTHHAIAQLRAVLAKHKITMDGVFHTEPHVESPTWAEEASVGGAKQQPYLDRGAHVSPRHRSLVALDLANVEGDRCDDQSTATSRVATTTAKRVISTLSFDHERPISEHREYNLLSSAVEDDANYPPAADVTTPAVEGVFDTSSRNSGERIGRKTTLLNDRGSAIPGASSKTSQNDACPPSFGSGEPVDADEVVQGEVLRGEPTSGNANIPHCKCHTSAEPLFVGVAGVAVEGTTNQSQTNERELISGVERGERHEYPCRAARGHSRESVNLAARSSHIVVTSDANALPSLDKKQGSRSFPQVDGDKERALSRHDLAAASVGPWAASLETGGIHREVGNGSSGTMRAEVGSEIGVPGDTRLGRADNARAHTTAARVDPSAPAIPSADQPDLEGLGSVTDAVPLSSSNDALDGPFDPNGLSRSTDQADNIRHELPSEHKAFSNVNHPKQSTDGQDERLLLETPIPQLQSFLGDHNERARPVAYDAEREDKFTGTGQKEETTSSRHRRQHSVLSSPLGDDDVLNLARPRTQSHFSKIGTASGSPSDRNDEGQESPVVIEMSVQPQGERIAGRVKRWSQQHQPTDPEMSGDILPMPASTPWSRGPLENGERAWGADGHGEFRATEEVERCGVNNWKCAETSDAQDARTSRGGYAVGILKPHLPAKSTSSDTRRFDSTWSPRAEHHGLDLLASVVGPQENVPPLETAPNQENDTVAKQGGESAVGKGYAKSCEKDGNRAEPLQSPRTGGRMFHRPFSTRAADDADDRLPLEKTALPAQIEQNTGIGSNERELVAPLTHVIETCNEDLPDHIIDGKETTDGRQIGTGALLPAVDGLGEGESRAGVVTDPVSNTTSLNEKNDEITQGQKTMVAAERKGGLSTVDKPRGSGDELAKLFAHRIVEADGGARYDVALAEVRQALAGAEDATLATLKKAYEATTSETSRSVATPEELNSSGSPTRANVTRNRAKRTSESKASAAKTRAQKRGNSEAWTRRYEPALEASSKPKEKNENRGTGPRTARSSQLKVEKQQHRRTRSTSDSPTGIQGRSSSGINDDHYPDNGGSEPVNLYTDAYTTDQRTPIDATLCRKPSLHHGAQSTTNEARKGSGHAPRRGASTAAIVDRRGESDQRTPRGIHAIDVTKRKGKSCLEPWEDSGRTRQWQSGHCGTSRPASSRDGDHVLGRREPGSDDMENNQLDTTTMGPARIKGGEIMERDRWVNDVHHPVRPRTADGSSRSRQNNHRKRAEEGGYSAHQSLGRQPHKRDEDDTQNKRKFIQGKEESMERQNRTGERYHLPVPQRTQRPRTSPANTSADHQHREYHRGVRQSRVSSVEVDNENRRPWRGSGALAAGAEAMAKGRSSWDYSDLQSLDRERRPSFPSGRSRNDQREDNRPMWRSGGALESSYFGWREASTEGPRVTDNCGEPQPYYVDPKQMRYYVPTLGMPPWRVPGPGEPGWEPILNYCEVKRDEAEAAEARKHRDYLVRRRRDSRGDERCSNEGSTGGNSGTPRSLSAFHQETSTSNFVDIAGRGEDEDDVSTAATAVGRRVNDAGYRPEMCALGEEGGIGGESLPRNADGDAGRNNSTLSSRIRHDLSLVTRDSSLARHDVGSTQDSSGRYQDGRGASIDRTNTRVSLTEKVVKVADLTRRSSNVIESSNRSRVVTAAINRQTNLPRQCSERPAVHEGLGDGGTSHRPLLLESTASALREETVGTHHIQRSRSSSPPALVIGKQLPTYPPTPTFEDPDNQGLATSCHEEGEMSSSATAVAYGAHQRTEGGGNSKPSTRPVYGDVVGGDDAQVSTSQGSLADNSTKNRSTSSPGTKIRRPSASGSIVRPLRQLLPVPSSIEAPTIPAVTGTAAGWVGTPSPEEGESKMVSAKIVSAGSGNATTPSSRHLSRRVSAGVTTMSGTASSGGVEDHSHSSDDTTSITNSLKYLSTRRRSSLPITALAESLEHRRRSDLLIKSIAAVANPPASPDSRRPRTSLPNWPRWAEDVQLRGGRAEGRSRLAPTTRTAGGRWRSSHGRLESLLPADGGLAVVATSVLPRNESRETGKWVLDVDPRVLRAHSEEKQYPLFQ